MIHPEDLQRSLIEFIEKSTGADMDVSEVRFSFLPMPHVLFRDTTLTFSDQQGSLRAGNFRIYFKIHSLLFGNPQVWRADMRGGEASVRMPEMFSTEPLVLGSVNLSINSIWGDHRKRLRFDTVLAGSRGKVTGNLLVTLNDIKEWEWKKSECNGDIRLEGLELGYLGEWFRTKTGFLIDRGDVTGKLRFQKAKEESRLAIEGNVHLGGLVYRTENREVVMASPAFDGDMEFKTVWDPSKEEIVFSPVVLTTPVGKVELSGQLNLGTNQVQDMKVRAQAVELESIPQYWIALKEALPFNLGFSGPSDIEMTLQGTFDHLSLHANWDLSGALLTYARYFSKPKDVPLNLAFDFLLRDGKTVSGDFGVRILDLNAKGTLVDFDLSRNKGTVNLITNKFSLENWQPIVPALEGFNIRGQMKVLGTVQSGAGDATGGKPVLNITLDEGAVEKAGAPPIQNISVVFDLGAVFWEMKQARMTIGSSSLDLTGTLHKFPEKPELKLRAIADKFVPAVFINDIRSIFSERMPPAWNEKVTEVENMISGAFLSNVAVESFELAGGYRDKKWEVKECLFQAFDGEFKLQGQLDLSEETHTFRTDAEVNHMSLAKYLERAGGEKKIAAGNLFLKSHQESEWKTGEEWNRSLKGQGSFSVTNGEFCEFDILNQLSAVEEFASLKDYASGKTVFDDLRGDFVIVDGKILTDPLVIIARDFRGEASGESFFDAVVNYRLDLYLSPFLTEKVLSAVLKRPGNPGEKQMGPIPVLISGPLSDPEIKPDYLKLPELLDQLESQHTQKILRTFLPEDALFERSKSI